MKISLEALEAHVSAYFRTLGAAERECEAATEMCVDAELRGHRSHGVRLLRNISIEYGLGAERRGDVEITRLSPSAAVVDGGYRLSPYVHREAVDHLSAMAKESGVAAVSVRHAGVSGALGYLVERVASRGLVALAFNSTPLVVVTPGTVKPTLGTNPLAIAVPRAEQPPLVLDMATSAIAFNEVMRRRAIGESIPEGVAVDESGEPTTDPVSAVGQDGRGRLLPFGGHRGYGIALMLELIVSALVTGRTAEAKRGRELHEPDDFGALYLAIDPVALGDPPAGGVAVESLLTEIVGAGGRLPGEQSRQRRERLLASGCIELDEDALAVLGLASA